MDMETDYRFVLANERTFLAYVRTALSLQVAGLGVMQFLTHGEDWVRVVLGLALVLAGSAIGIGGLYRWHHNEVLIRSGRDLSPANGLMPIAVFVSVVPLLAAIILAMM